MGDNQHIHIDIGLLDNHEVTTSEVNRPGHSGRSLKELSITNIDKNRIEITAIAVRIILKKTVKRT